MRLFNQLMASFDTNVQDGRLCALAKKLTPVAGLRIASNISDKFAVGLNFVSLMNVSSLSSAVDSKLEVSLFNVSDEPSCDSLPVRSITLLPDLKSPSKIERNQLALQVH